jgi:HD superfamily phosphohydrolase
MSKLKIINDPVHGFIKIPHEILFDVVEHRFFRDCAEFRKLVC